MIVRRLGPNPHLGGKKTPGAQGCPDIFELENGDFVIVGKDVTAEVRGQLPPDGTCGQDERIIAVPRNTLVSAKPDIPDSP